MKTPRLETPLGRRFAEALNESDGVQTRIYFEDYCAAFFRAAPALATTPERRARLAEAIEELVGSGFVEVSRVVDRSEMPALPKFLTLTQRVTDPPVGTEVTAYPWRPELAWAARLPLRRSEFDALKAIQRFLRDRGRNAPLVPLGERSHELFGDEKKLDSLRTNRRLFCDGRLSLDLLRAVAYAPPFAFRRVGEGSIALVLENVATYRSIINNLPEGSPIGLVIFGSGGYFSASVKYLRELSNVDVPPISEFRYFGDLDRRGLEIPTAADEVAQREGLPRVQPAVGLWSRLLRFGRRQSSTPVPRAVAEDLASWLPTSLRAQTIDVLTSGYRMAQEAVGSELLAADRSWAEAPSLRDSSLGQDT